MPPLDATFKLHHNPRGAPIAIYGVTIFFLKYFHFKIPETLIYMDNTLQTIFTHTITRCQDTVHSLRATIRYSYHGNF